MRDKEKQVKLLTKRISKIQDKGVKDIPNFTNIFIDNQELAEELLKHYQPKLPEHSVVLSGEQCVEIVQDNYNIGYERGSKETVEKIITKIKQFLSNVETVRGDDENNLQPEIGYSMREVDDLLDELEKQFSAEIKENYENIESNYIKYR